MMLNLHRDSLSNQVIDKNTQEKLENRKPGDRLELMGRAEKGESDLRLLWADKQPSAKNSKD